jgi:hypothetical protein
MHSVMDIKQFSIKVPHLSCSNCVPFARKLIKKDQAARMACALTLLYLPKTQNFAWLLSIIHQRDAPTLCSLVSSVGVWLHWRARTRQHYRLENESPGREVKRGWLNHRHSQENEWAAQVKICVIKANWRRGTLRRQNFSRCPICMRRTCDIFVPHSPGAAAHI